MKNGIAEFERAMELMRSSNPEPDQIAKYSNELDEARLRLAKLSEDVGD